MGEERLLRNGVVRAAGYGRRAGVVVILTLLALFLRFWQISSKPIWVDESFSIWAASQPLDRVSYWIATVDTVPPLYYLVLHGWMRLFGDSELAVRSLSALSSALAIPAGYLLGCELDGAALGVVVAAVLAVSPLQVAYGQEARMYAPIVCLSAFSMIFMARLLRGRKSAWDLAGYVLFTAAALLSHSTMVFLPAAQAVVLVAVWGLARRGANLGRWHAPDWRVWLAGLGGALLLWALWLPVFIRQGMNVAQRFWIPAPTPLDVIATLGAFAGVFLPINLPLSAALALLSLVLIGLGVRYWRQRPAQLVFLLTLCALPIVGEYAVSLLRPIYYTRTLLWASLPYSVLLASGIIGAAQLRVRHTGWAALLQIGLLAALLSLSVTAVGSYFSSYVKEPWDQAAAYVAEQSRADDLILFEAGWTRIAFDYYFRLYHRGQQLAGLPVDPFERQQLEPLFTPADYAHLDALVQGRSHFWVVYSHDNYSDPQHLARQHLRLAFREAVAHAWQGIEVVQYDKTYD